MQNPSIKYILKLSVPIFFANLAIPMVGIIDTGLMGNLGNLSYLSATSVAANLFSMIFWSFGFLRMGTVGLISQAYGKEDYPEVFNIILRNLIFVLLISLILISESFLLSIFLCIIFASSKQGEQPVLSLFKFKSFLVIRLILLTNVFDIIPNLLQSLL